MELYKLVRLVDCKVPKRYFSGENPDVLCRRYGVSRSRVMPCVSMLKKQPRFYLVPKIEVLLLRMK